MKKLTKKTKAIIAGASIVCVVGISGILAYFTDTVKVTNNAKMGIVDIDLKEYTLDEEGNKIEWNDMENVVPGEEIDKIPEIRCVEGAVDCYIRAKVEIICENKELEEEGKITLENIDVDEEEWKYCKEDGYYYYKKVLKSEDEPVELFRKVKIPKDIGNEWAQEKFEIEVKVDAIQARNYEPNFEKEGKSPWEGITEEDIQECIYPTHKKQV